jgi:probable rRNA maturation factor
LKRPDATPAADVVVGGSAAPLPAGVVRRVVTAVLASERRGASVGVTFLGRAAMRRLNAVHLGHDWATDVISFPLPLPDGGLAGDIYVCRFVAAQEARQRGHGVREELIRLVVHGTLHILGHDHDEGDGRTTSEMWRRQERLVKALT